MGEPFVDGIELARWQGMIDERTRTSVERLDTINGDVRAIKEALTRIESASAKDAEERAIYMPLLRKLASADDVAHGIAERLKNDRALGLTRVQLTGGIVGLLLIAANVALRLAGIDGL